MNLKTIIPVLPSSDIQRDVQWYEKYTSFKCTWHDDMYALLKTEEIVMHLQWHADTEDDPFIGRFCCQNCCK